MEIFICRFHDSFNLYRLYFSLPGNLWVHRKYRTNGSHNWTVCIVGFLTKFFPPCNFLHIILKPNIVSSIAMQSRHWQSVQQQPGIVHLRRLEDIEVMLWSIHPRPVPCGASSAALPTQPATNSVSQTCREHKKLEETSKNCEEEILHGKCWNARFSFTCRQGKEVKKKLWMCGFWLEKYYFQSTYVVGLYLLWHACMAW